MSEFGCGTNAGYARHQRVSEFPCNECSAAHSTYLKSRRHLYVGKYSDYQKQYAKQNLEQGKERQRRWRAANPERLKELTANYHNTRRARKLSVESESYTDNLVLETYGINCHLCDAPIDLTVPRTVGKPGWEKGLHLDHLIPLAAGGADTLANLRPAHGKCNLTKPRK